MTIVPGGLAKTPAESTLENSYADYVRQIFAKPEDKADESSVQRNEGNPCKKSGQQLLHDKTDGGWELLQEIYREHGIDNEFGDQKSMGKYRVYQPKSSVEYYSVMRNQQPIYDEQDAVDYKVARTRSAPNVWNGNSFSTGMYRLSPDYRRLPPPKQETLLIDYEGFKQGGLCRNPHTWSLYSRPRLVHNRDSRYLGTDFVLLNIRSPDTWYHRVDKLLDEANKLKRFE